MKIILFLLAVAPCFSAVYVPVQSAYNFQDKPEFQAILSQLKGFGEFESKASPVPDQPKTLSPGEQAVERAKARNRAILAQMNKKAARPETKDENILQQWKREEQETLAAWKKEEKDTLKAWKREQEAFLKRLPVYRDNTFKLPVSEEKIVEKEIPQVAVPEMFVVNSAFEVPVRDQGDRATCVAFAAATAMEILLKQNGASADLSEQYLYWAGKPNCQKAPCSEKGSWIRETFSFSERQNVIDVPSEKNCSYTSSRDEKNETQIPLPEGCAQGEAKVTGFEEARTLAETVEKLKSGVPVVIAAKLTENFFKNSGLVTYEGALKSTKEHSKGHAMLAMGILELPKKLKEREGNFCLLVVNSWGKGWGAGGYSCLTEKWILSQRQPSPFVALTKITVK